MCVKFPCMELTEILLEELKPKQRLWMRQRLACRKSLCMFSFFYPHFAGINRWGETTSFSACRQDLYPYQNIWFFHFFFLHVYMSITIILFYFYSCWTENFQDLFLPQFFCGSFTSLFVLHVERDVFQRHSCLLFLLLLLHFKD